MKRKKTIISAILVSLIVTGIGVISYSSNSGLMSEFGRYMKEHHNDSDERYAEGNQAIVLKKDIQQAKQFYLLAGIGEEEANKQAIDYVFQREALYQNAIENGYEASDQEVKEYLKELREFVNSADNREDYLDAMHQFESEEAYWEFQFEIYKKDLPIQNYVRDLEQQFAEKNNFSDENGLSEDEWINYFEDFKKNLVEKEQFRIIE